MKTKKCWGLALVIVGTMVIMSLIECPKSRAESEVSTIKVGMNVSTSGSGALWGYAVLRPAEIMADKINGQGGLVLGGKKYLIKLVTYDHTFEPTKSVENIQRMILQDKINFVVQQGGAASYPTFPIAAQHGILMLHLGPSAAPVMKKEFPYIFYAQMGNRERSDVLYQFVKEKYGIKSVVIVNPDDESGWNSTKESKVGAGAHGVEIKASEFYGRGLADFYPLLTRVLPLKPDFFELGMSPVADEANFIKQARELGFKGKIGTQTSIETDVMLGIAGKEALEGLVGCTGSWDINDPKLTTEEKALRDEYLRRYGPPFPAGALAFGWAHELLIEALKKAGSIDKDKVKKALETERFLIRGHKVRCGGTSVYGYPRQAFYPLPVTEMIGGKLITVEVRELYIP